MYDHIKPGQGTDLIGILGTGRQHFTQQTADVHGRKEF